MIAGAWSPEQWVTVITATISALTAGVIAVLGELRRKKGS